MSITSTTTFLILIAIIGVIFFIPGVFIYKDITAEVPKDFVEIMDNATQDKSYYKNRDKNRIIRNAREQKEFCLIHFQAIYDKKINISDITFHASSSNSDYCSLKL